MEKEIIKILINQHRALQSDLGLVSTFLQSENVNVSNIIQSLSNFKSKLLEHLKLENDEFYPGLLKKMKEKEMKTEDTVKFIQQMKSIGVVVMAFLEKYNSKNAILGEINVFKKDLNEIILTLNLRIESEEQGVFTYWNLF